jgi:predicted Zn finger-like uncharacterized protein
MALATQCPHCHTTFRVAHDQLKLRAGLVRCGACKQIFNGIENLLRPEDVKPTPESASGPQPPSPPESPVAPDAPVQAEPATVPDASSDISTEPLRMGPFEPPDEEQGRSEEVSAAATIPTAESGESDNPLLRMTLMDFTHAAQKTSDGDIEQATEAASDQPDPLERVLDDLQRKPWRRVEGDKEADSDTDPLDQADNVEYEEPSFVRQGRRRQQVGRILRISMAVALPFLLVGALAQGAYTFRDQLAAWFPQTKPLLSRACTYIGCQIGLPMQIESVSIESSELQALAPDQNRFSLVALLRNRGETVQAWPNIELTLNDTNEKALARRIILPRDYLPSQQEISKGFAPKSEQSIKLFFELDQLKASGYRVYLFYP